MEGRERATLRESKRESPCLSPSHIRSSDADADPRHPRDPVRPPPPRVLPFVAIATRAIYPDAVAGAAPAVPDVLATAERVTCPSSFPPPMTALLRPSPVSPKNLQAVVHSCRVRGPDTARATAGTYPQTLLANLRLVANTTFATPDFDKRPICPS